MKHSRAVLILSVIVLASCGTETKAPRVVLVGIDGAEWNIIDSMIAQGELPNFAHIIEGGVRGDLETLPGRTSPVIWNTVVTGRTPEDHGIPAWTVKGADGKPRLVTSNMRKAATIWEILSDAGLRSTVIGWIASWPATPLDGYLVTPYSPLLDSGADGLSRNALPKKGTLWEEVQHQTFPEELIEELSEFRVAPTSIEDEVLANYFDPFQGEPSDREESLVKSLRYVIAADTTFADVAHELFGREDMPFQAVYFGGVDAVSHRFWRFYDSSVYSATEDEQLRFGNVIPEYYRTMDAEIGRILEGLDENATLILCSDHGFQSAPKDFDVREQSGGHRMVGVLVLYGRGIRSGEVIEGASVYDLTPTMLALLGLPVAEDMPGDVLTDALLSVPEVRRTGSYQYLMEGRGDANPIESAADDEIMDQLRSLGYVR